MLHALSMIISGVASSSCSRVLLDFIDESRMACAITKGAVATPTNGTATRVRQRIHPASADLLLKGLVGRFLKEIARWRLWRRRVIPELAGSLGYRANLNALEICQSISDATVDHVVESHRHHLLARHDVVETAYRSRGSSGVRAMSPACRRSMICVVNSTRSSQPYLPAFFLADVSESSTKRLVRSFSSPIFWSS